MQLAERHRDWRPRRDCIERNRPPDCYRLSFGTCSLGRISGRGQKRRRVRKGVKKRRRKEKKKDTESGFASRDQDLRSLSRMWIKIWGGFLEEDEVLRLERLGEGKGRRRGGRNGDGWRFRWQDFPFP